MLDQFFYPREVTGFSALNIVYFGRHKLIRNQISFDLLVSRKKKSSQFKIILVRPKESSWDVIHPVYIGWRETVFNSSAAKILCLYNL